MACFLVPAAEAVVATIAAKVMESKEKNEVEENGNEVMETEKIKVPFSYKLKSLSKFLWGGSVLLAFEHVWHGEVVPYFPFLTAASDPAEASVMLHEMATVGVSMAVFVTVVWSVVTMVSDSIVKRPEHGMTMQKTK